jgi:transcriptional regulator with XRE-family HTH domain
VSPLRVRIREAREHAGLTQAQLALQARVSASTVYNIERGGRRMINLDVLQSLADALHAQPGALLADTRTTKRAKRRRSS